MTVKKQSGNIVNTGFIQGSMTPTPITHNKSNIAESMELVTGGNADEITDEGEDKPGTPVRLRDQANTGVVVAELPLDGLVGNGKRRSPHFDAETRNSLSSFTSWDVNVGCETGLTSRSRWNSTRRCCRSTTLE